MQKTSTGMIGKTLPVGPESPSQRRTVALLEHQHERAERGADREQVQQHRLDRDEQRAEPREEREERAADDEQDHAPEVPRDRVLVVGVEAGPAADADAHARQARDVGRVPGAQLAGEAHLVARRQARGRNDLEERRAAVARLERPAHRGRQKRQVAQAVGAVRSSRAGTGPARRAGPCAAPRRASRPPPALGRVELDPGRKVQDDPQRVHDVRAAHGRERVVRPDGFRALGKPVAERHRRAEPRGLRARQSSGALARTSASTGRRVTRWPHRRHASDPPAFARRPLAPDPQGVDARAEQGEDRGKQRHGQQEREHRHEQPAKPTERSSERGITSSAAKPIETGKAESRIVQPARRAASSAAGRRRCPRERTRGSG